MVNSPAELVQKLNGLAPNIGLGYADRKRMINNLFFLIGDFILDMGEFSDWMEETYPEYLNQSVEQFLMDKDPEHINEWKGLFGV